MLRSVRSFLGRKDRPAGDPAPAAPHVGADAPRPERQSYLVGDIHGRSDLLEQMLELIDAHIGGTDANDPQLVFLGDYVDHGPRSDEVLARLRELTASFPDNVTCLMGNHERMLLDFLTDPVTRGARWLRAGGAATLLSYRIDGPALAAAPLPDALRAAAGRLRAAMGEETLEWLTALPLSWQSGTLWAVHAGADPYREMTAQSARVLLYGHPEFDSAPRGDGLWIAHGHVEADLPRAGDGRIALDTAAWSTGRLTACAVRPDGRFDFLQT